MKHLNRMNDGKVQNQSLTLRQLKGLERWNDCLRSKQAWFRIAKREEEEGAGGGEMRGEEGEEKKEQEEEKEKESARRAPSSFSANPKYFVCLLRQNVIPKSNSRDTSQKSVMSIFFKFFTSTSFPLSLMIFDIGDGRYWLKEILPISLCTSGIISYKATS